MGESCIPAVLLIAIGNGVQGAVQVKQQAFYGWESVCHVYKIGILSAQSRSYASALNHTAVGIRVCMQGAFCMKWGLRVLEAHRVQCICQYILQQPRMSSKASCTTAMKPLAHAKCVHTHWHHSKPSELEVSLHYRACTMRARQKF